MPRTPSPPPLPDRPSHWLANFRYRLRGQYGEHLSPEALGSLLGVSGATIRRWESGHATPSDEDLQRFARVCNLAPPQREFIQRLFSRLPPAPAGPPPPTRDPPRPAPTGPPGPPPPATQDPAHPTQPARQVPTEQDGHRAPATQDPARPAPIGRAGPPAVRDPQPRGPAGHLPTATRRRCPVRPGRRHSREHGPPPGRRARRATRRRPVPAGSRRPMRRAHPASRARHGRRHEGSRSRVRRVREVVRPTTTRWSSTPGRR